MYGKHSFYKFIDRVSFRILAAIFFVTIAGSACLYWLLSSQGSPSAVVRTIGGSDAGDLSFLDSLYFSVVTFSSLGYGDLSPKGASRMIANVEVLIGVMLVGLSVAKLASELPAGVRKLNRRVSGIWIERVLITKDEQDEGGASTVEEVFGFLSIGLTDDGMSLRFGGNNYDRQGGFKGSFDGRLIQPDWPTLRFYYNNSIKSEDFTSGVSEIRFEELGGEESLHYTGEVMDFARKSPYATEAWCVYEPEDIDALESPKDRQETIVRLIRFFFPESLD